MHKPQSRQTQPPNERGLAIGLFLLACLASLLVAALREGISGRGEAVGPGNALLGIYIMGWGALFLASYFFSHKTFLFRFLMWVCEDASRPASPKMAFFYFVLCLVIGGSMFVSAMSPR